MVFQFGHVTQFWDDKLGKWKPKPIDWPKLKSTFATWQAPLHGKGWNSLFWGNHDLPRAVSRYGDEGEYRVASAKALATILHLMEGTPYIYQGEEIGMTNAGFTHIDQYRDVETPNLSPSLLALSRFASNLDGAVCAFTVWNGMQDAVVIRPRTQTHDRHVNHGYSLDPCDV